MNLKFELEQVNRSFVENTPAPIVDMLKRHLTKLINDDVASKALQTHDKAPNFKLMSATGEAVSLYDLLEEGPVVLSFYRGSWCPYCNLELQAYQERLEDIRSLSAQFIAVSPEVPDESLTLVEKHALAYEVLSDLGNKAARDFGIVLDVDGTYRDAYESLGIDLKKRHGSAHYSLPIPATYVIDTDGSIALSYVNADYTQRLDPQVAIDALQDLI